VKNMEIYGDGFFLGVRNPIFFLGLNNRKKMGFYILTYLLYQRKRTELIIIIEIASKFMLRLKISKSYICTSLISKLAIQSFYILIPDIVDNENNIVSNENIIKGKGV
jgi:hypothetical protein